jgi:CSLREA domain-containing protein
MIRLSSRFLLVLVWILSIGAIHAARPHPAPGFSAAPPPRPATTISVTTHVDDFTLNNTCSLREAVYAAVNDTATDACAAGTANDVISLPAATYVLTRTGVHENDGLTGDLDITGTLRITGATSATTIIDSDQSDRILDIFGGTVSIDNLTLRKGSSVSDGGAVYLRAGSFTADQVTFDHNLAIAIAESNTSGGAIANLSGTLTVTSSLFTNNGAEEFYMFNAGAGGAIYSGPTARSTISDSAFYDTKRYFYAETIFNAGLLAVHGSTFGRNPSPIVNSGTAMIESSGFFTNTGPVIWNSKTLTMSLSELAFNTSPTDQFYCVAGGGMFNQGSAYLNRVFIHDNSTEYGAGVASTGVTVIRDSAIVGNRAPNAYRGREDCGGSGGGILSWQGSLDIVNTTIAANWAEYTGGGLFSHSRTALITNTSIVSNYADLNDPMWGHENPLPADAGGVYALYPITVTNTLLAHNGSWLSPDAADCEGPIFSVNSLVLAPSASCTLTATASLVGVEPLLGPLADHGGATLTYNLLPGSPAIDAGALSGCPDHDQRGVFRPQDGDALNGARCDIGAYEYVNSATAVTATPTSPPATATATATAIATVGATPTATGTVIATPTTGFHVVYLPYVRR